MENWTLPSLISPEAQTQSWKGRSDGSRETPGKNSADPSTSSGDRPHISRRRPERFKLSAVLSRPRTTPSEHHLNPRQPQQSILERLGDLRHRKPHWLFGTRDEGHSHQLHGHLPQHDHTARINTLRGQSKATEP